MDFNVEIIKNALPLLLAGAGITIEISAISVGLGLAIGCLVSIIRLTQFRLLRYLGNVYVDFIRGTPLLVQIFLIYYGLGQIQFIHDTPALWWVVSEGSRCAVLALALNTAAYTSEILRGGLVAVPAGLVEAAKACGMSRSMRFRRIEFPLAIRQAIPAYGNELVLMVKGTSLASTITVLEITGYAKRLMSQTYAIFEVFAIAGVLYLALNLALIGAVRLIERRLMRHNKPVSHSRAVVSTAAS